MTILGEYKRDGVDLLLGRTPLEHGLYRVRPSDYKLIPKRWRHYSQSHVKQRVG